MTSWICSICSFTHPDNPGFCMGCSHPGDSLELFDDCQKCGHETRWDLLQCEWCFAPLRDEEGEEEQDEDEDGDGDGWGEFEDSYGA